MSPKFEMSPKFGGVTRSPLSSSINSPTSMIGVIQLLVIVLYILGMDRCILVEVTKIGGVTPKFEG